MRKALIIPLLLISCSLVPGQNQSPQLIADIDGAPQALPVSHVAADARILGSVAETRVTLTFQNPHNRVLEGDLRFPLPEGATISGYALDIRGVMVDGVVVEKHEGRRVFEKIERRGADPGLAEWVQGNMFRTRIYPIPARGSRRIMVRYVSDVTFGPSGAAYHLPLFFGRLKQMKLRVEVARPITAPLQKTSIKTSLALGPWRDSQTFEGAWENIDLSDELVIDLPGIERRPVEIERSRDGHYYFLIRQFESQAPRQQKSELRIPKQVSILWDASGSRAVVNHERELRVLEAFLRRMPKRPPVVELVVFRNSATPSQRYTADQKGIEALLGNLRSVAYDGGTSLSAIEPAAPTPDFYLLFSDGFSTFGGDATPRFRAPVYTISDSAFGNFPLLRYLAESTGGMYFNLATADEKQVSGSLGRSALRRDSPRTRSGAIDEILQTSAPAGQPAAIVGRINSETAEIELSDAAGKRVRHTLAQKEAVTGELLRTYWAQQKIQTLLAFADQRRQELIELGRQYGLVTPGTSLIVLEGVDQYVEFGIEPPESLPDMRAEWKEQMKERAEEAREDKESKLAHILELWRERVAWWETDFSKKPKKLAKESEPSTASASSIPSAPARPADQPAQPAAPAPRVAEAAQPANQAAADSRAPCPTGREHRAPWGALYRGAISGVVTDVSGGVIPGAEVLVINQETGAETTCLSNDQGRYLTRILPGGFYGVSVDYPGFKRAAFCDVELRGTIRLDVQLDVGNIAEEVTVSASEVAVQSESGEVSEVISSTEVSNLATNGREFSRLVAVQSGVATITRSGDEDEESEEDSEDEPETYLQAWDPKTPDLDPLRKAWKEDLFGIYLEQKKKYGASPAFYLDCADFFSERQEKQLALQVLSNIAELYLDDPAFLRILGHRLEQLGYLELAAATFERVLAMRPEEPQSLRDLALALVEMKEYGRAIQLLSQVVMNEWDRFDEIEVITLTELNRIIPVAEAAGVKEFPLDPQLIKLLDADVRVVITWDSDATDIDLWVTEPTGEKAFYKHPLTDLGGHVSRDFTDGYGPEEYMLRRAAPGKFKIEADYYGSRSQRLRGPVTVQVDVYTNYGRRNENRQSTTIRLADEKQNIHIADVEM